MSSERSKSCCSARASRWLFMLLACHYHAMCSYTVPCHAMQLVIVIFSPHRPSSSFTPFLPRLRVECRGYFCLGLPAGLTLCLCICCPSKSYNHPFGRPSAFSSFDIFFFFFLFFSFSFSSPSDPFSSSFLTAPCVRVLFCSLRLLGSLIETILSFDAPLLHLSLDSTTLTDAGRLLLTDCFVTLIFPPIFSLSVQHVRLHTRHPPRCSEPFAGPAGRVPLP